MWHCPHCGAPQAETARCWVCRKSSTTCSTCRHFRPSLAADIGYCALDRARRPLTGLELRGCWTERPAAADAQAAGKAAAARGSDGREAGLGRETAPARGFVPVDDIALPARDAMPPALPPLRVIAEALETSEARTSLFGELDR